MRVPFQFGLFGLNLIVSVIYSDYVEKCVFVIMG